MPANSWHPWQLLILLIFSVAATLAADWLVSRFRRPVRPPARSLSTVAAAMAWMFLLFVAGLIARRYIERMASSLLGYLGFALVASILSLIRAWLYQQGSRLDGQGSRPGVGLLSDRSIRTLVYLLFAFDLYLLLSLLLHRPADLLLVIPLSMGALLPDLDSWAWSADRLGPFFSARLGIQLEPQGAWHSLLGAACTALITAPLIPVAGIWAWGLLTMGFLSHLALNLPGTKGVMLLWPATHTRYRISGPVSSALSEAGVRKLAIGLAATAMILLLTVGIGSPPKAPAAVPSYEQTVERYYGMRGKNLAIANVEGTWQATGRRVIDRFEILNARDLSFILLDRYTGRVFTAGRTGADDMYLNRISLSAGAPVRVKATEIQLGDQNLAQALPLIYEMQREPGLQHIYISGDVVLPSSADSASQGLPVDLSQSSLRRIEAHAPGHYSLHYLTASDLIKLANVGVEHADLIIVATSISPPEGPTATPLPSPPAASSPGKGTRCGAP